MSMSKKEAIETLEKLERYHIELPPYKGIGAISRLEMANKMMEAKPILLKLLSRKMHGSLNFITKIISNFVNII
jgi:hypothetical protein